MKGKKTVLREEVEVNHETGDITRRKSMVQFNKEPEFVKLYLDCLALFSRNEGLDACLNDMLLAVLKRMSYATDDQIVCLNAYIKEQICNETGKSIKRLEQAITKWVKSKVLVRVARGVYKVNPNIFGKGDWIDIERLRATFDFTTGEVTTEREYKQTGDGKKSA